MEFNYTLEDLSSMRIGALKQIAQQHKISGYTKYRNATKNELVSIIWNVMKVSTAFPQNTIDSEPDKKIKVVLPKKKDTLKTIQYDFKDDIMDTITIDLHTLSSEEEANPILTLPSSDDITPEILLEQIQSLPFCEKIANSLLAIYEAKYEKYKKLETSIQESVRIEQLEKERMSSHITSKQDLDAMFPLIITNTAFLCKVKTLKELAQKKYNETLSLSSKLIKKISKNIKTAITDKENGIMSVSGESRQLIRNQLCKKLFILSKGYRPFMDSFINMVFTGSTGVGKTKLAKTFAFVFQKSGILLKGELLILSPNDLVSEYVGQTSIKTAGRLMKGLESVIFVDEAYQIMPCVNGEIAKDAKSFGSEAITEIVNFLDKNVGMTIMIVAGYEREMNGCFFAANEELRSRFPIRIQIPTYYITDLLNIFLNECVKRLDVNIFDKEIARYIYTIMTELHKADDTIFSNQAVDMMNLSSMFLNSYYGTFLYDWNKFEDAIKIVNSTFNEFLYNKGYSITIRKIK